MKFVYNPSIALKNDDYNVNLLYYNYQLNGLKTRLRAFCPCPEQSNKIEGVVLKRVCILQILTTRDCKGPQTNMSKNVGSIKTSDCLFFYWMSLTKWLNNNWWRRLGISVCCLTTSNQKEAISGTVSGWHVWILLRIPAAWILWDFNFLRRLAPGCLHGFSIGRYEEKRESFDLFATGFESGAMRFLRGKSLQHWSPFKTWIPPLSFYYKEQSTAKSNSFKIAQKTAFEVKRRLYTTVKVIQRLFIIDLYT